MRATLAAVGRRAGADRAGARFRAQQCGYGTFRSAPKINPVRPERGEEPNLKTGVNRPYVSVGRLPPYPPNSRLAIDPELRLGVFFSFFQVLGGRALPLAGRLPFRVGSVRSFRPVSRSVQCRPPAGSYSASLC